MFMLASGLAALNSPTLGIDRVRVHHRLGSNTNGDQLEFSHQASKIYLRWYRQDGSSERINTNWGQILISLSPSQSDPWPFQ
jgi:hypothetical protein